MPSPAEPEITNYKYQINAINLRLAVIHVGAAFQPRLNGYYHRVTSFRGWKATPTRN